ncbi:hypothetical protein BO443_170184 [Burkholderia orbicola]
MCASVEVRAAWMHDVCVSMAERRIALCGHWKQPVRNGFVQAQERGRLTTDISRTVEQRVEQSCRLLSITRTPPRIRAKTRM